MQRSEKVLDQKCTVPIVVCFSAGLRLQLIPAVIATLELAQQGRKQIMPVFTEKKKTQSKMDDNSSIEAFGHFLRKHKNMQLFPCYCVTV